MSDVPGVTPVTIPVPASIVATAILLLVQTPPPPLTRLVGVPMHTCGLPAIGPGTELTVTVADDTQPDGRV